MLIRAVIFLFCLSIASPAVAGDATSMADDTGYAPVYADPTIENLIRMMLRFNGFDIHDDKLLDDYAMITDCEIVKQFYEDDFRWNQIRTLIRDDIRKNINTYPTGFYYDASLQLDRYDFKSKSFRFTDKTQIKGVNSFLLSSYGMSSMNGSPFCGDYYVRAMPSSYRAILDVPVTLAGLAMTDRQAEALLRQLHTAGNMDRTIWARFNLRVLEMQPLRKPPPRGTLEDTGPREYSQPGLPPGERRVNIKMQLDSINFYEDQARTKLIMQYEP